MNRQLRLTALILTMTLTGLAHAQDDDGDIDIENAPTPTNILELLPDEGIDAVDLEYWTVMSMDNLAGGTTTMYSHWSAQAVDGSLVIESAETGDVGGNRVTTRTLRVYSAQGVIQSYQMSARFGQAQEMTMTGVVDGDEMVLTTTIENAPGLPPGEKLEQPARRVPLEAFNSGVSQEILPLVHAYHIREGHVGYTMQLSAGLGGAGQLQMRIENTGTEMVDFDGEQYRAHVLIMLPPGAAPEEAKATFVVLEDGSLMSMTMNEAGQEIRSRRITAAEAREALGLDEADEEGEAADAEAENEAGE